MQTWEAILKSESEKPYMQALRAFLVAEKAKKKIIYPKSSEVFKALALTPFEAVQVVILGQDPYHGPNQAQGLCFSVPETEPLPPSLLNIYKELETDCGIPISKKGSLESWARQGVLLLNSVLTVEQHHPASHQGKGWEQFTDTLIEHLNREKSGLVFVLWGAYAQKKGRMIDPKKHYVLHSVHPSPLSAHRGFFGSNPFSKTNHYLQLHGKKPIQWDPEADIGG